MMIHNLVADKLKSYDDVMHEREMLEFAIDAFLRSKGWTHTSSTPGCLWLWCKTLKWSETNRDDRAKGGFRKTWHTKHVMTDKKTALWIQRTLDDQ